MKIKKAFLLVFVCFLVLAVASILFACDLNSMFYDNEEENGEGEGNEQTGTGDECNHEWQMSTNGVRSTCLTEGYDLYICTKCNAEERKPLPLSGHVYTNNVCIYCGVKATPLQSFSEGNVVVSMYYAVGSSANDPEDEREYQLIFEGNGNLSSVLWSRYSRRVRNIKIEGKIGLPDDSFSGNTVLTDITVTGTVTRIGDRAFSGCTSLSSVTLSSGVEYIGEEAFSGCEYLTSATIYGSPYIGRGVFAGCDNLRTLVVPDIGTETERFEQTLSAAGLKVKYDDCNVFGVVSQSGGDVSKTLDCPKATISDTRLTLFDELSELYSFFIKADSFSDQAVVRRPEPGSGEYNKYLQFFNKIKSVYDDSQLDVTKLARYAETSGIIVGINKPFDVLMNKAYRYVAVQTPLESQIGDYYERSGSSYVQTADTTVDTSKQYYSLQVIDNYYVRVSSPAQARMGDYFELLDSGVYVKTKDGTPSAEKTYYRVCTHDDYITVISRLLGFSDTSKFIQQASAVASAFSTGEASVSERLKFDGAVYTSSGYYVFPYAVENALSGTVLLCGFVDTNGNLSFWVSSIEEAFRAGNLNNERQASPVVTRVYGRRMLFEDVRATSLFGSLFAVGTDKNYNQYYGDTYFFIPTSLRQVTISDAEEVESYAFANVSANLETVTFGSLLQAVRKNAFYNGTGIEKILFPDDSQLSEIEENAFAGCESLTSFVVPAGVTVLSSGAFSRCLKMETIEFAEGSNLTVVRSDAFRNCASLERIVLPDGVETVGANAFYGCSSMASIYLNGRLSSIGLNAFYDCSFLSDVYLVSGDVANVEDNSSRLFGSGRSFSLWIEKSINVSSLGYVGKNYVCPMSHLTTEVDGKQYYLWQNK